MPKRSSLLRLTSRLARDLSLPWMLEWPRRAHIVPTNACNLRCRACSKSHYPTDSRHMAREVYSRIRDEVLPHVQAVHLQGLGEPTLSPLFVEMVEDAVRHDLPLSFVTNASRLTREQIDLLAKARADVTISIDGARAETHEYSRPGSDFRQLFETLETLRDARRQVPRSRMTLHFSTVLTRLNVAEAADIVRLAGRCEVASVVLITPGMGDRTDEFALATIGYHEDLYRSHLPDILRAEKETGVLVRYPPYLLDSAEASPGSSPGAPLPPNAPPSDGPPAFARRPRRIFPRKCYAPFTEMYFDVDGWVRPCCRATWLGMGHIGETSARSVWNNKYYRRLRRTLNSNNPPEFCRTCTLHDGITGGDEQYLEKLYARGLPRLPDPPGIGLTWSKEEGRAVER